MDDTEFGFVAELQKTLWIVSAATRCNDELTSHDVSGFLGSWKSHEGSVFFKSVSGDCMCKTAMDLSQKHCDMMNAKENRLTLQQKAMLYIQD